MIITIKGADFSTKNIGTLSTWTILTTLGSGATYSGNRIVDKDGSLSATITIADGYELGTAGVSVTMGTTNVTSSAATVNGNTITISIATVTDNVTINVPTLITGGEEIPDEIDISSLFTSVWRSGAIVVDSSRANYPAHQANQTAYRCSNTWIDISAYESAINVGAKLQITMNRAVNTNHQIYGLVFFSEAVNDATKVLGTLALQYDPVDFGVYSVETREIEIPSGTKYVKTTWLPEANETELGAVFSAKITLISMGV